ncbi:family 1 extracellular solute-binding protein [Paenibacillus mucilaginosus 3016]|uniref:Family 1 extracellular solute-binding protein n=1 Tax=Paenibacillus mucilaginosus 3016 TaxID=1116391 RepID=H6NC41_9BACL|nr:extracellular solute-binding protein [Paenibacillus mucilaginosus]AFC28234.1 family 1 extracellular solute-binding protein [Paenibacillus mucilaginosus 3016]WFA17054.1 extracellular solute-binding protein [Paenibacillus mucilaginosus]
MKTQRFKQISAFCALTLAASVFAGCANKTDGGAAAGDAAADTGPVKITMMANLQTPEVPSDKLEKLIEEKTNSQLEISWIPDGSYDEKFQASFATGTLPQVVYLKNQASFILMRDAMKDGQFWEIGPLLKDYPNLKSLNQETLKNTAVAGKIYTLYQERQPSRTGIIYRKDWADKLGLAAPQTADDIYNMLKKFKETDAAGKGNTIPLSDRNDLVYGAFKTVSMYFGTPNNWGVVDGKLVPEFETKGYLDTMKFFQKLHKEGLINQDFPVTSKTDQQNLMYSGKSGMYIGTMGDVKTMQEKTVKNVPDAMYDVTNEIKGVDGKNVSWGLSGYGTVVVFPKSAIKTENELKRILGVMDKFYSPEVADLLKYGIENEHYSLKDGKVQPVQDPKLIEKEVRPYLNLALYETTNVKPALFSMPSHEKANTLSNAAEKFMVQDPTAALDSPTYNSTGSRLQDIIKDATYQFILGKIDEAGFKAAVDKWKKDGGQKIIDEYNAQYNNAGK